MQRDIHGGTAPGDVVTNGLIPAITVVGEKFQNGEVYIPEMMLAARVMSATLNHFKEKLPGRRGEEGWGRS